jgi:exodeoxyribonuclease VII large subunit
LHRLLADAARRSVEGRDRLVGLEMRLDLAVAQRRSRLADRLEALDRIRMTLGYAETLERGFAIVRGDGKVVTTRAAAEDAQALEIEFRDGRLALGARPLRKPGGGKAPPGQGSLF